MIQYMFMKRCGSCVCMRRGSCMVKGYVHKTWTYLNTRLDPKKF